MLSVIPPTTAFTVCTVVVADGSGTTDGAGLVDAVDAAGYFGVDPPAVPAMIPPPIVVATITPTMATVIRLLLISAPRLVRISRASRRYAAGLHPIRGLS